MLDGLDLDDLRDGETDDPIAATEEGLVYVPPIDPPLVADPEAGDGITVGAGVAVSAQSEPDDDDHRSIDLDPGSERNARIHAALRADAATSRIEPFLSIGSVGGRVVVRGIVDDVDDADMVAAVIERLPGVTEVIDETELIDQTALTG